MAQIDALVETVLGNDKLVGLCQELFKDCAHLAEILEREIGTFMTFFNTGPFITVVGCISFFNENVTKND